MPLKSHTRAPSTFEEQTLPEEPEHHPSTQQEEQPCELTLPPEDFLQEEQDPEEPLQAETLINLAPNLAEAIMLMTEQLCHCDPPVQKAKAKEPDTFDGSEPQKLNNFILLCNLFFCSKNPVYSDDSNKVTFVLSYLWGAALEFFEPSFLDSDEIPNWLDDWPNFVQTLCTQFGPVDPTADAEDGTNNLNMHDNQHIVKYNVKFNHLAICTGWDEVSSSTATILDSPNTLKTLWVSKGSLRHLPKWKPLRITSTPVIGNASTKNSTPERTSLTTMTTNPTTKATNPSTLPSPTDSAGIWVEC